MKKIVSFLLVLSLVLGLAQPALASEPTDLRLQKLESPEILSSLQKNEDPNLPSKGFDPEEEKEDKVSLEALDKPASEDSMDSELEIGPDLGEAPVGAPPSENTRYEINSKEDFLKLWRMTEFYSGFGPSPFQPGPGYGKGDAWHHGVSGYDIYLNQDITVSSDEIYDPIPKNEHDPKYNFGFGLNSSNFYGNGHTITIEKGNNRPIYPIFGEIRNFKDRTKTRTIEKLSVIYKGDVVGSGFAKNIYYNQMNAITDYDIKDINIQVQGSILPYSDLTSTIMSYYRADLPGLKQTEADINEFSLIDTRNIAVGMSYILDGANVTNFSLEVEGDIGSKEVVKNQYARSDLVYSSASGLFYMYGHRPAEVLVQDLKNISVEVGGGIYARSQNFRAESVGLGYDLQRKKLYDISLTVGKDIFAQASGDTLLTATYGAVHNPSIAAGLGHELHFIQKGKLTVGGNIQSLNQTDIEMDTIAVGLSRFDYIHSYKDDTNTSAKPEEKLSANPHIIDQVSLSVGGSVLAESTRELHHRPPVLTSGQEGKVQTAAVGGALNNMAGGLRLYDDFTSNTISIAGDIIARSNYGDKLELAYSLASLWGNFTGDNNTLSARSIQAISPGNMAYAAPYYHFLKGKGNTVKVPEGIVIDSSEDYGGTVAVRVTEYDGKENTAEVPKLTSSHPCEVGGFAGTIMLHRNHNNPSILDGPNEYVAPLVKNVHIEPEITITNSSAFAGRTDSYFGGFAGRNYGVVEDSSVKLTKSISLDGNQTKYAGGFVGFNSSKGKMINSFVEGVNWEVKGSGNNYFGGFVGWNSGMIGQSGQTGSACSSKFEKISVNSQAETNNIGGFVGQSKGEIYDASTCFTSIRVDAGGKNMSVGGFAAYGQGDKIKNSTTFINDSIKTANGNYVNVGGFRGIGFDVTDHDNACQVGEDISLEGNQGPVTVGGYAGKIMVNTGSINPEVFRSTALVFGNITGQTSRSSFNAQGVPQLFNTTAGFIGVAQGQVKNVNGNLAIRPVDIFNSASYVGGTMTSKYPDKDRINGAVGLLFGARLKSFTVLANKTDDSVQNVTTANNYLEGMGFAEFKDDTNFYVEVEGNKRTAYSIYLSDQPDGSQSFDPRPTPLGEITIASRPFQEKYWGGDASRDVAKLPYTDFDYLTKNDGNIQFIPLLPHQSKIYSGDLSKASLTTYCDRHAAIQAGQDSPIYDILGIPGSLIVSFDLNYTKEDGKPAGALKDIDVKKGSTIEEKDFPADPERADFVFKEWNTEPDGSGQTFTAESVVTQSIRVYAQWEKVKTPTPSPDPTPSPQPEKPTDDERIGGKDRIDTGNKVSGKFFDKSRYVIIARNDEYPDALTASLLAKILDCPILLNQTDSLDERVVKEIKRLGADQIIIAGGDAAISRKVEKELGRFDRDQVERIGGKDRYETSALIAKRIDGLVGGVNMAIIASGEDYPDALASAPLAAKKTAPILLTRSDRLPPVISKTIKDLDIQSVYISGGRKVVALELEKSLPKLIKRFDGDTRYETAALIAMEVDSRPEVLFLASGENFPDALTIGPVAAKKIQPILLTKKGSLPKASSDFIEKARLKKVYIIGGDEAIFEQVIKELRDIL